MVQCNPFQPYHSHIHQFQECSFFVSYRFDKSWFSQLEVMKYASRSAELLASFWKLLQHSNLLKYLFVLVFGFVHLPFLDLLPGGQNQRRVLELILCWDLLACNRAFCCPWLAQLPWSSAVGLFACSCLESCRRICPNALSCTCCKLECFSWCVWLVWWRWPFQLLPFCQVGGIACWVWLCSNLLIRYIYWEQEVVSISGLAPA